MKPHGLAGRKQSAEHIQKRMEWCLGRPFSAEHKQKLSDSKKGKPPWNKGLKGYLAGDQHYNWKGGITPENAAIRNSLELKLWRESVFARDEFTCVLCFAKSGNGKKIILHADHIKPFCLYPELRTAIDNGRTLCVDCHKATATFGSKARANTNT
jgi:hypothetical protein